jgi:hypothetical protein
MFVDYQNILKMFYLKKLIRKSVERLAKLNSYNFGRKSWKDLIKLKECLKFWLKAILLKIKIILYKKILNLYLSSYWSSIQD